MMIVEYLNESRGKQGNVPPLPCLNTRNRVKGTSRVHLLFPIVGYIVQSGSLKSRPWNRPHHHGPSQDGIIKQDRWLSESRRVKENTTAQKPLEGRNAACEFQQCRIPRRFSERQKGTSNAVMRRNGSDERDTESRDSALQRM
jgi:hypothetical protein